MSEIVDAAFALYRRDSGQYILVMAVASVPQLVFRLLVHVDQTPSLGTLGFVLLGSLIGGLTYVIGTAAIVKFGAAVYLGEPADLTQAVRAVIPKLASIFIAGILKWILYFIGALCFFVGAFYVAARFFAVTQVIVLEDAGVGGAFTRTSELSEGRKGHIFLTLALVWIIYALLSGCVLLLVQITHSEVLAIIVGTAFTIVAYPVIGLTNMLLYYDCRIRGEGFDIEQMAASLGGPAPGAAGATT